MLGLAELARADTALDERSIDHLQRLVAAWALLADLSFADLLLYALCTASDRAGPPKPGAGAAGAASGPAASGPGAGAVGVASGPGAGAVGPAASGGVQQSFGGRGASGPGAGAAVPGGCFVVLAHVRATTGPTVHPADPVGTRVSGPSCRWLRSAVFDGASGEAEVVDRRPVPGVGDDDVVEEGVGLRLGDRRRFVSFVPVRLAGRPIAVLVREAATARIRHDSPLEGIYRGVYEQFAQMISDGAFPYDRVEQMGEFREPRVSDGVMLHDREARITYASPNAISALHRLGVTRSVVGCGLRDLGLNDTVIRRSFWRRRSTVAEFDSEPQTTVVLRAYPLMAGGRVTGAVALLRDISELRHRDRLLVSKDATIREIHHRVKNNLQTVSSLLKLQARRLDNAEAKVALESSVRRVCAIAMVHEHLSLDTTSDVDFDDLASPLLQTVEEALAAERSGAIRIEGAAGSIDGEVAMPLAVVLVELVQNALQHSAAPAPARAGGRGAGSSATAGVDASGDCERVEGRGRGAGSSATAGDSVDGAFQRASWPASQRGELVAVRFGCTADMVTVAVTDNGPGVPEGFSLDRDAGLGLTIVRTFVVHHLGGTISIRAASLQDPRGTVVDIAVPRRPATVPIG